VRIPSLSATEDTPIKIYYGNSTVSSQENVEGVWDSNFKLVHHLEENPTGTIYDSTSNNNDATSYGTMTTNNQVSGIIDGALDFDGSDDYISWTTAFSSTTGTYSWWMYPHSVTGERNYIADDAYRRRISLWDDVVKIETNTEAEYFDFDQSSISANIWTQVVFVRSGNSGDLYVNGSWVQQKTVGGADTLTVSAIGGTVDNTRMVDGLIDEVRISNVTRSADWISTEYINQFDSTNFYSIGSEESQLIWPHTDYQYRKSITIEKTKVSGSSDLADFPILLDIYDTDLRKKAHPDGNDIIFTGDFGVKLDHEIEVFNQTFNNSHAHLVAWVRVPSLSGLSDTKIEMYYGNYSVSQQENPKGVWDSNSVAVWHLNDNFLDSTVNSNDGTNSGSIDKTGYIANGQDFDGNDDYIDVGSGNSVDNVFIGGGTVSAWIYPTGWGESLFGRIVDKSTDTLGADGWGFIVNGGGVIKNKITFYRDFSTERGFWYSPTDSLSLNQWQHVVVTYNEDSTSNEPILYINGVSQTIFWDDLPIGTPSDDSAQSLHIGKFAGANSRNFDGIIDELHISTIERSADWIITEYNNQLDPASFYLISSEEAQTSWPQSDFRYRKQITINNNQVNSPVPLTNFPFMVNISDTDLRDKTQPDGDDIIFTDITGMKLDHEIEYFNQQYTSSFANLVAWVRIPVLHATIDTDLYMYYGNLTINSQENPTGVWDSNYKGVWHLSEDPTSTAPQFIDSTTNNNHGTASNLVSSDQITGQIDGALNFTDSDQDYINIGDQSSLNMGSGDFTLELWFNYDGTNKGPLAGKGSYGTNGIRYYLAIETTGGVIKAEIDTNVGGKREVQSASTYADSLWHHAVMVRDGNSLRLYIDGVEDSNSPTDITGYGNLDLALPFYINTLSSDTGGSLSDWSTVKIDEVRVSNIARSANWVETEFNNQNNPTSFYSINTEDNQANWTEYPVVVEWVAGDSENSNTVSTNTSILGVSNQLYIAAVSVKNYADTTSVTGLGLTWIELEDQTGGRSQTGISVWYAIGSPTTGSVTATLGSTPKASVLHVFRIANVNPSNPIGDRESANTNGENGAGSGGVDDTYAYLDIITTSPDATVLGLIGQRGRITTAGAGYTIISDSKIGSGGDIAGLTSEYKFVPTPGTLIVNSTFNIDTDWAIVGLEINPSLGAGDFTPPIVNNFGVEDSGTGTGTFWANVTDDNAVNSVTIKLNSTNFGMTYNGSLWIYQTAVNFLDYLMYQIINASDSSNNNILFPSSENNYTFNLDYTLPTVIDWVYDNTIGYNGTFRTNVSDSWGIIDTVYVTVTSCQCVSSNTAIMQLNGNEYINDTILMKSGSIFFEITVNDTANNIYASTLHSGTVINKAPSASNLTFSPSTVTSNDSLTLNYNFFDIDDDTESGTEIRWYNNSVLQPTFNNLTTIPLSALYKGDQWYATVKPKDGALFGSLVTSSIITIENTLPLASNVNINPGSAVNTTTLTVSYSYSDIDTDAENIANREIRWYKNGS
jgi:hypothetical protein